MIELENKLTEGFEALLALMELTIKLEDGRE
jgi:hypothetical protein